MKLNELSKDDLIKLLTLLCERNKNQYMFYHTINEFLMQRWNDMNNKLLDESDKCDITTISGYKKWQEINKKIDDLQSVEKSKFYCILDELKEQK